MRFAASTLRPRIFIVRSLGFSILCLENILKTKCVSIHDIHYNILLYLALTQINLFCDFKCCANTHFNINASVTFCVNAVHELNVLQNISSSHIKLLREIFMMPSDILKTPCGNLGGPA